MILIFLEKVLHSSALTRLGDLTDMYLSQFGRLEVQDQGAGRVGVWWELCPWVIDGCLLACWSCGLSAGGGEDKGEEKGVCFYKDTNPVGSWRHIYDLI